MVLECQNSRLITVQSDVYSFGVVLLEIVCCKSNFEVNVSAANDCFFQLGCIIDLLLEN